MVCLGLIESKKKFFKGYIQYDIPSYHKIR